MNRVACLALAFVLGSSIANAQEIVIVDQGPGGAGRALQAVLRRPHRVIEPDSGWFVLARDQDVPAGLVVLGRAAAIEGTVRGDVVVVGGDLFIRPSARVTGRTVAIGGGVYASRLAAVGPGGESFRDDTFDMVRSGSRYELRWRSLYADASPPLSFPGVYGLRVPSYDRVNGASVRFGPTLTFASGKGELTALATWRSHIGKVDPSAQLTFRFSRRLRVEATAERGSFSNDEWIFADLLNSASVLVLGEDTRNYFRADRGEATVRRLWEGAAADVEPLVGVRAERSWAVGNPTAAGARPWSMMNRGDSVNGMRRPNPAVPDLHLASLLAGVTVRWEAQQLRLRLRTLGEHLLASGAEWEPGFTQLTTDLRVDFPVIADHEYQGEIHWVTTPAGTAPPQRFGYVGGRGTLPFLDLLEQGGGEVLLVDQRYSVPVLAMRLGFLGSPTLQLRHRLGGAGATRLPALEQMIGLGLHIAFARVELQIDPATSEVRVGLGFTFTR